MSLRHSQHRGHNQEAVSWVGEGEESSLVALRGGKRNAVKLTVGPFKLMLIIISLCRRLALFRRLSDSPFVQPSLVIPFWMVPRRNNINVIGIV